MFTPDEATRKILDQLGASHRTSASVAKGIKAEIIDLTTKQPYAMAYGSSDAEAVSAAAKLALTAPKPLTRAQQADPTYQKAKDLEAQLAARDAELAELRAQMAEGKRGRKGKAQHDPPERQADETAEEAEPALQI